MERGDARLAGVRERYEGALWWTMEQLGITESIERKVIAAGDLSAGIDRSEQGDEIGSLINSFVAMRSSLVTVSAQAEALADQEFDDPVLEKDVPGAFGESLSRMSENLRSHTEQLEGMTNRLERRSQRLEGLVEASVTPPNAPGMAT